MYSILLGPATVRMISETGPTFPLPLHLPPGHMVQQMLDENGVLTHVIMSQPAPPPPPPPHHHVVSSTPFILLLYIFINSHKPKWIPTFKSIILLLRNQTWKQNTFSSSFFSYSLAYRLFCITIQWTLYSSPSISQCIWTLYWRATNLFSTFSL